VAYQFEVRLQLHYSGFDPTPLNLSIAFVAFYVVHMVGITVGYHRLLAHRSYKCPKAVEYILVMAGYLGFESSPMWWATLHRAHHRYTETRLDPHAPRFGIYEAYIGWFLHKGYPDHINPEKQSRDMINDPLYKFLDQGGNWAKGHLLNSLINFSLRAVMALIWGWQLAAVSLVAALIVQQMPLLLNVVCHLPKAGYKNFNTPDESVNVGWVAFLTLGEGWHNNHHAFPGSARHGMKPSEIDPSWLIIRAMRAIGLVSWLNEANINTPFKPQGMPAELELATEPAPRPVLAMAGNMASELVPVTVRSQRGHGQMARRARQKNR
jgi:stearoyl-CoA desaturase (delta-9 desaturase)